VSQEIGLFVTTAERTFHSAGKKRDIICADRGIMRDKWILRTFNGGCRREWEIFTEYALEREENTLRLVLSVYRGG
jgi:hypothetical protein